MRPGRRAETVDALTADHGTLLWPIATHQLEQEEVRPIRRRLNEDFFST